MADAPARSEPLSVLREEFSRVVLALEPAMRRYSLRARKPDILEQLLGLSIPTRIGAIQDGVLCLGPDEWLMRAPCETLLAPSAGNPASVVEISERQIAIGVEGPDAAAVLAGGCPLDLDHFTVGTGKRTIFEGVEIVLIREGENRFVVEVWRSFAEYVRAILVASAKENCP